MRMQDQATIFPSNVVVCVSDVSEGTMTLKSLPENPDEVWRNRIRFIEHSGGLMSETALVYVTYNAERDFCTYRRADAVPKKLTTDDDAMADGVVTNEIGIGMFLPIADCCAVVLYDQKSGALMLSHIGRQSLEVAAAIKSLNFMHAEFGTNPADVLAWLSPSVGSESYPIFFRDNGDLKTLIHDDLVAAGMSSRNIEISKIDTAIDRNYFSHSQYQKGQREFDGRMAVFAMLAEKS